MSDERQVQSGTSDVDRRYRRTQKALLDAFARLFFHRRYDAIRVGDIVEDADVGRSTFYEHYRSKDDMLVQSMSAFFDILADAASADADVTALERLLDHFWENRGHGRYLLSGPPARHVLPRLSREVADRIEQRLLERGVATVLPLRLVAKQAAEAQFALIRAWLAGEAVCTPAQLATGLRLGTIGSITALAAQRT